MEYTLVKKYQYYGILMLKGIENIQCYVDTMTGNRWYNQVFKFWIWQETQTEGFHSKSNMNKRKIMVRMAKRKLKQITKKEIKNE